MPPYSVRPLGRARTVGPAALAVAALLVAGLAGCASGSGPSAAGSATTSDSAATTGAATTTGAADARTANVTISAAHGCQSDRTEFAAGGITFQVRNTDATAVSEIELLNGERIVGEKENLPPGLSGQFAVKVPAGNYTLYCPGAAQEKTTITVTGEAQVADQDVAALLKTATENYGGYVSTQVGYLVSGVAKLNTALHGDDLAAAQVAYAQARPFYEKIEPVAESFTLGKDSLDADIDARANDVPASQWKGFHRIEKGLFQDNSLAGLGSFGDGLVANVAKLQKLTDGLSYQATELANGAQELLDEVASSKITGEEERYSHIDMLDLANNDEGAEQAFAQLQPALDKIDPTLSATIAARFTALDALVNTYRSDSEPSGYVLFTALTNSDKRQVVAAVKAVQEPLSKVASKVADA